MNSNNRQAQKPEKEERRRARPIKREQSLGKEGRRRWLFLLVDLLLLASIAAIVIFLVSLLTPWSIFDKDEAEVKSITYTVEIAGVDQASLAALQKDDTVTDSKTGAVIGTVVDFSIRPYEVWSDTAEGESVGKVTYPEESGLKTVTVTLSVDASYLAGVGYTVGDTRIAVDRTLDLAFRNYAATGVCVSLTVK